MVSDAVFFVLLPLCFPRFADGFPMVVVWYSISVLVDSAKKSMLPQTRKANRLKLTIARFSDFVFERVSSCSAFRAFRGFIDARGFVFLFGVGEACNGLLHFRAV